LSNVYKAEDTVVQMMKDLVGQYHPDLALIVDEIAVVFREKAASKGGRPVLGKASKASPLIGILGGTEYKFILELAQDQWLELDTKQQTALLDHLLCSCRADQDDQGEFKFSLAPPDVSFFYDELDRHGDWRPRPADEEERPTLELVRNEDKDEDEDTDLDSLS
jgi:Putative phage metallopeptidase